MSKVLKCDCSINDAFVSKTLTLPGTFYVQADLAVPSSTLTALRGGSNTASAALINIEDTGVHNAPIGLGDQSTTASLNPPTAVNSPGFGVSYASIFPADELVTVVAYYDGTDVNWTVNGTSVFSPALGGTPTGVLDFGGFASDGVSGEIYYVTNVKIGTTPGGHELFQDDFSSGDTSAWTTTDGDATVIDSPYDPPVPSNEGFCIALTNGPLDDPVTWTRIDNQDGVHVTKIEITRGRTDERSKTSPGTVTISGYDTTGALDPTNPSSPFYPNLTPIKQASVSLFNPVTAAWSYLFRGYIESFEFTLDPSEKYLEFEIGLVDMLDILNDAEIIPDEAGNAVPSESQGDCYYTGQHCDDRLLAVLADASTVFVGTVWPVSLLEVASGNVFVQGRVYSRGTSLLQVIDEACDGEFPGATNRFVTKAGAFAFRGRYYRFVPTAYEAASDADRRPNHQLVHWNAGDLSAYKADGTQAVYTGLKFSLNKTNLINTCFISPIGATDSELGSGTQFKHDATSIAAYGPRTSGESLENLITGDADDGNTDLQETASFADATVHNYKDPTIFASELTFQNPAAGDPTLASNVWALLCGLELSDLVTVSSTHPGGGGFNDAGIVDQDHFVESIKYELAPLQGDTWDVTLTVGLSSRHHFTYMPGSWNPPTGETLAAQFTWFAVDLDVQFYDESSPGPSGPIVSWAWDFGDSNTATSENPAHTYASSGTYTVSLTVTGSGSDGTSTVSHSVTV